LTIAGDGQQRDPLVVAPLLSRVLPVADRQHLGALIQIAPGDAADFCLAHGGGDRKFDHLLRDNHDETQRQSG
jgi:hypothetical protein